MGWIWMWSIAHFITNNLNYCICLNNLSIFCYRLALELPSSLKQNAFQFSLKARLILLAGWVREEAHGEYHRLCVTRRLYLCSLSFLTKERWNDGGVLTCSSQNNLQCLNLPFWSSHTLLCVPVQFLQHLRIYVEVEAPGSTNEDIRCISSVSLESTLGRKARAEFSNHYHPRTWLHSPNIIYIHGFLPSAILENVYKATKVNNANVSLCLGGCTVNCWR